DFRAIHAEVFSSRLPSDPGLKLVMGEVQLSQRRIPRRSILGQQFVNLQTGELEEETERTFHGEDVRVVVGGLPVFYTPTVNGAMSNPIGPLHGVTFRHDRIFGYHIGADFDVFNLLGLDPRPGNHWLASIDELTKRGFGAGSVFEYTGDELLGFQGKY